ncbi:MAG TPA: hypothetical protein ENG98_04180 [Actinobacteria bacterium]|nr:hypothetical protein [Actinomycetota bacterium]
MSWLRRFEHHRFVGTRDSMVVYDSEDEAERALLDARIDEGDLFEANLLQTFGPDTLAEARNRGFLPLG